MDVRKIIHMIVNAEKTPQKIYYVLKLIIQLNHTLNF